MAAAGRRRAGLLAVLLACSLSAALSLAPASLGARGHVFSMTFGTEGSGPGQLREPMGVAVNEASGDVYVADVGNNRVQWFSYNAGTKTYEVAGQITAADGAGTGTLTEGSETVESVATSSGTFVVGQTVGGEGIPAETTIVEVNRLAGTIKLSHSVEAGRSGVLVPLDAEQPLTEPRAIAIDNSSISPSKGDVYVSSGEYPAQVVDKFTATGEFIGQITSTEAHSKFGVVEGVAVDPFGALWVLDSNFGEEDGLERFSDAVTNEFVRSCALPPGNGFALAVDAHDNLYLIAREAVSELDSECKTLSGSIGGEATAAQSGLTFFGVATEASSGDVYIDNVESVGRFTGSGSEVERFGSGDLAAEACNDKFDEATALATCLGGLAVNGAASGPTAGDVYAAVGHNARIVVFAPEEPAAPRVEGESVTKLTDGSATLQGKVNPQSLSGEEQTSYHFEYGACDAGPGSCKESAYTTSTPAGVLAASFDVDGVSAPVEGLLPGTTYHFRLVASNGHGETQGADRLFTTRNTGEFRLLDARQWEMVSPSDMHGALIEPLGKGLLSTGGPTQAAVQGGAIAYLTNAPIESDPIGNAVTAQVLSTRGAQGWSSQDIAVPHVGATGVNGWEEMLWFSEDLLWAAIRPLNPFTPLSADASEQTAYLRNDTTGAFTPLVSGCPAEPAPCSPAVAEHADVAPGTVFGNISDDGLTCPPETKACGPAFVGATPDFKHVILHARAGLKPGISTEALYEWNMEAPPSQRLQVVSLEPATTPGGEEPAASGPQLGFNFVSSDLRGAVSADGSRVFFSAGGLYMRDTVAGKTIRVDLPEASCGSCGGGNVHPEFQFASVDGSRVFFTDRQKLTSNGGEYGSESEADLYVCELHEDVCALRDLTPHGAVVGNVMAPSKDDSWVYFAANGALVPGSVKGNCTNGNEASLASATCDLYVVHRVGGVWGAPHVITAVSGADALDWSAVFEKMLSRVSPDGRWLAFMSQRSLTGYDNRDAVSGLPDKEVYLYDAEHERLTCASCDPSGARPIGAQYSLAAMPLLGPQDELGWIAASVPKWVNYADKETFYQPRYLSDSGRLFFDSRDALVTKDVNGTGDVYEFEPEGESVLGSGHACSPASTSGASVYRPAHAFEVEVEGKNVSGEETAGCVGLISSGSSGEESAFMDASENGGDVFFISTARLSPLDVEGGLTMYDAHECTSASACIAPPAASPPPCSTEASCRIAPTPQPSVFGPSGSATFSGPGNASPPPPTAKGKTAAQVRAGKLAKALRTCHKLKKRTKRHSCERAAHKRYGAHNSTAGRAMNNHRRAGR